VRGPANSNPKNKKRLVQKKKVEGWMAGIRRRIWATTLDLVHN